MAAVSRPRWRDHPGHSLDLIPLNQFPRRLRGLSQSTKRDLLIMSDQHFGGVTIPSQQTLAPASAPNIAFRPACSQLVPIERAGQVLWTVTMSDGARIKLATYEPMPEQAASLGFE